MPPTETADAPAAPAAPGKTAFEAAFEKATTETPPEPKESPAPKKEPAVKEPPAPKAPDTTSRKMPDSVIAKSAAKTEPAKPDEAKAPESEIDKIPDPVFKNDGERNNVANLRKKAKEFESKASELERKTADLETKIKDYESRGKDTDTLHARLADLEKQNQDAMALVRKVNIELDPEFRKTHIEGRSKLIKSAQAIIDESGGDSAAVETALNLKGKPRVEALREIAGNLDQFQSGRLGRVIDALTELDDAAEAKRNNPDSYLAEREKEEAGRRAKESEEFTKTARTAYESAEKKLGTELEVLKPVDGLDWWNKQAQSIRDNARKNYETNTDPAVAAEVCIRAEAMEVYRDYYLKEREQTATLEAQLAERDAELKKLYGKSPSLTGGKGGSGTEGGKKGFFDVLNEAAGG